MGIQILDNTTRTYYITFENADGEEFTISPPNYLLLGFDGFEQGQAEIQMSKAPYQDGKTYIDNLAPERIITLEISIFGDNQQEVFDRRLNINKKFNSKLGIGILKFQQVEGSTYYLDVITKSITFGNVTSKYHNVAIIELIAPNPFWYNPTELESVFVGFSGGFVFPMIFPISFGTVTSQITVVNNGNVDTPVILSFVGEITDPVLQNLTTGKDIIVVKNVPSGSTLIINTAFGNKYVQIYDGVTYTDAFEYVDPSSIFWQLIPGENIVKYTASFEGTGSRCSMQYYNRYSGV